MRPAGLDRRFYAFAVDEMFAGSCYAVAGWLAWGHLVDRERPWTVVWLVAGTVVTVSLAFALLLGHTGASPGKALLGLRAVHHRTGAPIGVGRSVLRSLLLGGASLPTFGLGLATLAWTAVTEPSRQRRGWHDHVARSVVVDVRPVPVEAAPSEPQRLVNLTAMRLVPAPGVQTARRAYPEAAPVAGPAAAQGAAATPGRWRVAFDTGDTFVVAGLGLVGRRPEARAGERVRHLVPLPSSDMSLSKTHAQFHLTTDGVLVVMDRGSTNGSVLLRQGAWRDLVPGRPATLVEGDRVRFGDRAMTVGRED